MKGIVLAGGTGSRLFPVTLSVSKQLLPLYDKPMIYYPISVLMLAGIRDILIITTPQDQEAFKRLLGNGENFGVKFSYVAQASPDGLAQAFILGEEFMEDEGVVLILGDNIFYGYGFVEKLQEAKNRVIHKGESSIFAYHVNDPWRYGVCTFNEKGEVSSIEEKPQNPKSNYAVTGLYFYTNKVKDIAKKIKPSARGELEITSVNQEFLNRGELKVEVMGQGFAWLDTGTYDSLLDASEFVAVMQKRIGLKIACPEEIAYKKKWIDKNKLESLANRFGNNEYGNYLLRIIEGI